MSLVFENGEVREVTDTAPVSRDDLVSTINVLKGSLAEAEADLVEFDRLVAANPAPANPITPADAGQVVQAAVAPTAPEAAPIPVTEPAPEPVKL